MIFLFILIFTWMFLGAVAWFLPMRPKLMSLTLPDKFDLLMLVLCIFYGAVALKNHFDL